MFCGQEVSNYAVRMSCGNRQRSLSTGTPNRDHAAQIAKFTRVTGGGGSIIDIAH